jgi:hypothetical protein
LFTLTLSTFPLVPESDDVDERSATRMEHRDLLLLLIGYGRDQATNPAFNAHPQLPLSVQRMKTYSQFEHLPRGHRIARTTFVARGSAYDVQFQFAGPITASSRTRANTVLRLLHFYPSPKRTPNRSTSC